jgi:hypothetical protein
VLQREILHIHHPPHPPPPPQAGVLAHVALQTRALSAGVGRHYSSVVSRDDVVSIANDIASRVERAWSWPVSKYHIRIRHERLVKSGDLGRRSPRVPPKCKSNELTFVEEVTNLLSVVADKQRISNAKVVMYLAWKVGALCSTEWPLHSAARVAVSGGRMDQTGYGLVYRTVAVQFLSEITENPSQESRSP